MADGDASTWGFAEFLSKWQTDFSRLRGGPYNRTVVVILASPRALPHGYAHDVSETSRDTGLPGGFTASEPSALASTTSIQCATWSSNAREYLGATELVVQSAERPTPVRKQLPVRHAGPHNDRHCSCATRRSERPVRAAGEGRGPRRAVRLLRRMGRSERHCAVPGAGGGADRNGQWRERRPGHADRVGQVAGGHRRAVRGAGYGTEQPLHRADQGAGQR